MSCKEMFKKDHFFTTSDKNVGTFVPPCGRPHEKNPKKYSSTGYNILPNCSVGADAVGSELAWRSQSRLMVEHTQQYYQAVAINRWCEHQHCPFTSIYN